MLHVERRLSLCSSASQKVSGLAKKNYLANGRGPRFLVESDKSETTRAHGAMEALNTIFKGDGEEGAEKEKRFPLKSSPLRKLSGPRHIAPADGTVKRVQFKPVVEEFYPSFPPPDPVQSVYKTPDKRQRDGSSGRIVAPNSSVDSPAVHDTLRRVSVVFSQHINFCVGRYNKRTPENLNEGLFRTEMMNLFVEENFVTPSYTYTFVRAPLVGPSCCYRIKKRVVRDTTVTPTVEDIYEFMLHIYQKAQLSRECTIVSLMYVERLMKRAKVPIMPQNWRMLVLCGLLLSSKVWQDLSIWNAEFCEIFPEITPAKLTKLEWIFLKNIGWDMFISGKAYAKYYFGLRSLTEQQDFRRRYTNLMTGNGGQLERATNVEERSAKMEAIYSLSL